jgi:hypothetical protein
MRGVWRTHADRRTDHMFWVFFGLRYIQARWDARTVRAFLFRKPRMVRLLGGSVAGWSYSGLGRRPGGMVSFRK